MREPSSAAWYLSTRHSHSQNGKRTQRWAQNEKDNLPIRSHSGNWSLPPNSRGGATPDFVQCFPLLLRHLSVHHIAAHFDDQFAVFDDP